MSKCCVVVGMYSVRVSCPFREVQCLSVVLLGGTMSEYCVVSGRYSVEVLCSSWEVQCLRFVSFQ